MVDRCNSVHTGLWERYARNGCCKTPENFRLPSLLATPGNRGAGIQPGIHGIEVCGAGAGYTVQNHALLATQRLHGAPKKKAHYRFDSRLSFIHMGWLMGLEPTTTGITILKNMYLPLLNGVGTININQQLTSFSLDK